MWKEVVPGTASLHPVRIAMGVIQRTPSSAVPCSWETACCFSVWEWRKGHKPLHARLLPAPNTPFPPMRQSYLLSSRRAQLGLQRPCCGMTPSLLPLAPLCRQGPSLLPWHPGHSSATTALHCPGGCLALLSNSGLAP